MTLDRSLLQKIREKELEVSVKVDQARREADQLIEQAKNEAKELVSKFQKEAEKASKEYSQKELTPFEKKWKTTKTEARKK